MINQIRIINVLSMKKINRRTKLLKIVLIRNFIINTKWLNLISKGKLKWLSKNKFKIPIIECYEITNFND